MSAFKNIINSTYQDHYFQSNNISKFYTCTKCGCKASFWINQEEARFYIVYQKDVNLSCEEIIIKNIIE